MFTLKKIALLGAAGLAALSMSCSDSNDDDTNSISTPVASSTGSGEDASWKLSGGAVVKSEHGIDSIYLSLVTESGSNVGIVGNVLPRSFGVGGEVLEVDLVTLAGDASFSSLALTSCPEGTTVTAYFLVKATFVGGNPSTVTSEKSNAITFTCPTSGTPNYGTSGVFSETGTQFTLGGSGSNAAGSAADLDVTPIAIYTQGNLNSNSALKNAVDVVYDGNDLYSAGEAALLGKNAGTLANTTSQATLFPVTSGQVTTIKASTTPVADAALIIAQKLENLDDEFGAVAAGNYFLLSTSEGKTLIIEVESKTGTTAGTAAFLAFYSVE